MKDITYSIKFYSQWHCGSGESQGADLDALVIKDRQGLPYVPGKTVKGLVRDSFLELDIIGYFDHKGKENEIFGCGYDYKQKPKADDGKKEPGIINQSRLYFSNAVLKSIVKDEIEKASLIPFLFNKVTRTSIDEKGVANEMSLRSMEVTVPVDLTGKILNVEDQYVDSIIDAMKFIKRLGSGRNRGLGRCSFEVLNISERRTI